MIDRTQATLPDGYSLWKAVFTYGGKTRVSVLVSAKTKEQAKRIINIVYDYLSPKMLAISFVDDDTNKIYDRSKEMILGDLIIKERTL